MKLPHVALHTVLFPHLPLPIHVFEERYRAMARDVNLAFRSIRDFESGLGYVNHGTIGAEAHLPFGGVKATGNGHREVGQAALDFFSEWKSVYIDYSGKLQRAQIDTTFVDEE